MKERKLILIGGGHVLVQEILDRLSQSGLPLKKIQVLNEGERIGEIHEYRNQPLLVTDLNDMIEEEYDVAALLSQVGDLEKLTSALVLGNVPLVDMAGLFEASADLPVLLPDSIEYSGMTLPMVSIVPSGVSHALTTVLHALKGRGDWYQATLAAVQGVAGLGTRQGMDELFDQTRSILGFGDVEIVNFPHQIAYNVFHDDAAGNRAAIIRSQARIVSGMPELEVNSDLVWAGFFVGLIGTIWLESKDEPDTGMLIDILKNTPGIVLRDSVGGVLSLVGSDEIVVSHVPAATLNPRCLTLRFGMDNLHRGSATTLTRLLESVWMEASR